MLLLTDQEKHSISPEVRDTKETLTLKYKEVVQTITASGTNREGLSRIDISLESLHLAILRSELPVDEQVARLQELSNLIGEIEYVLNSRVDWTDTTAARIATGILNKRLLISTEINTLVHAIEIAAIRRHILATERTERLLESRRSGRAS